MLRVNEIAELLRVFGKYWNPIIGNIKKVLFIWEGEKYFTLEKYLMLGNVGLIRGLFF